MGIRKTMCVGMCLAVAAAAAPPARAQGCRSSEDAAVRCFVDNAVQTNLTTLRYGMTITQFKAYGVAVSKILQTQQTYLATVGIASAVADAMPPTNSDSSANLPAQQTAVNAIVDAEVTSDLVVIPTEANTQQLKYFSLDLVSAMNDNSGMLLCPGTVLRLVDSFVIGATANGAVNWSQADANLSAAVDNLTNAKLLKLPPSITSAQFKQFVNSLAQIIYNYKVATGRSTL